MTVIRVPLTDARNRTFLWLEGVLGGTLDLAPISVAQKKTLHPTAWGQLALWIQVLFS